MKFRKLLAALLIGALLAGMALSALGEDAIAIVDAEEGGAEAEATAAEPTDDPEDDGETLLVEDVGAPEPEPEEVDPLLSDDADPEQTLADPADATDAASVANDPAGIPVDADHFPDPNFRAWVSAHADTDATAGYLSDAEIAAVTAIDATGDEMPAVTSLEGIGYFTELTDLDVDGDALTGLDLSQNAKLTNLTGYGLAFDALDLSANTALKKVSVSFGTLSSLNVSGLSQLTTLILDECPRLSGLNLRQCASLRLLSTAGCREMGDLDLSGCPALETLNCAYNGLDFLDVTGCPKLTLLECSGNNISGLDLSKSAALEELVCDDCDLVMIDTSANSALRLFSCAGNRLETLDVSKNAALVSLECYENKLKTLKLDGSGALEWLRCEFNALQTLDVTGAPALKTLMCGYNKLKKLDLINCKKLEGLHCQGNALTWVGVWNSPKLAALANEAHMKVVTDFDYDNNYLGVVDWYSNSHSDDTGDGLRVDHGLTVLADTPTVSEIWLNRTAMILYTDESAKLTVTILPVSETNADVAWSSSNTAVATVKDGAVEVVGPGKATITATSMVDPSKKAACKVTVKDRTLAKKLTKTGSNGTVSVAKGQQIQLDPTFATDKGWTVTKYSSSASKVASVSDDGLVTAKKAGKATITVKTKNKKKATVVVKITDPTLPRKVELNKKSTVKLKVGNKLYLRAILTPATAQTKLKWTTGNRRIATVSDTGVVTPIKAGTIYIRVRTANGKSDRVRVKVVDPTMPTKLTLNKKGTVKLEKGDQLQLEATMSPSTAKSELKWSTTNKSVAKVSTSGLVTVRGTGAATITCRTARGGLVAKVVIKCEK